MPNQWTVKRTRDPDACPECRGSGTRKARDEYIGRCGVCDGTGKFPRAVETEKIVEDLRRMLNRQSKIIVL